jgi:hypothetical protein
MEYYAVLTIATLTVLMFSAAVWRKTRQPAFMVGFAFLYYWSLYGGWLVVNRAMGSDRAYRFEYLFYKLFPVYLDQDYLWSLVLYSIFVITVQMVVLRVARRPLLHSDTPETATPVSHFRIVTIAALLLAGAYYLVWDVVTGAAGAGQSAYGGEAVANLRFLSVYQLLHEAAGALVLLGACIAVSGSRARFIAGTRRAQPLAYAVVIAASVTLTMAMGSRNMLVFAIVAAALFYTVNSPKPSRTLLATSAVAAVAGMALVGVLRSTSGSRELGSEDLAGRIRYVVGETLSQDVEAFAAHASMYGALQKDVPLTYGASFVWLASSVLPGAIRPAVVPLAYEHYATHVGASQGQGFTLHHATGWYINFGLPGVVAGAAVLGWIWASLFNAFIGSAGRGSHAGRMAAMVMFWTFTGYLPILIRSGIEAYKGVLVEGLLFPTMLMVVSSVRLARVGGRIRVVPLMSAPRWTGGSTGSLTTSGASRRTA